MKIIIGIILIYTILVVSSAVIFRWIMSPLARFYKGTKHEETWLKLLKEFALGYFIVGLIIIMFFF